MTKEAKQRAPNAALTVIFPTISSLPLLLFSSGKRHTPSWRLRFAQVWGCGFFIRRNRRNPVQSARSPRQHDQIEGLAALILGSPNK
jgi:hypothetical protein